VNLGIDPPKGVLLFGPPGTGKTLCARAVANRTDACFIRVIGSELVQKYVGEVGLQFISSSSSSSVLFQALGPYAHKTHKNIQQNTCTRNTRIMQIQVKLNKSSTISSCNCKHQKQLRAAR